MKKGLLSILAGALLVVGCQNYDDQFDNLESQISALASTVAGLSQVQSDLASLAGTVSSLSSTVAGLGSAIDTAVANGLADITADIADLEAALDGVANSSDLADLTTAVAEAQGDLTELLANSSVFQGSITINSVATLDVYHAMGSSINIVNGSVDIDAKADMSTTKLQEVVDNILTTVGSFDYQAESSAVAAVTFQKLTGTQTLTIKQGGDYRFDNLTSATNVYLMDDYKSKVNIIHFGALSSVSKFYTTTASANLIDFSKASELHLTSLAYYPPNTLTIKTDKGATLAAGKLDDVDSAGKQANIILSIEGPASFTATNLTDGSLTFKDVATVDVDGFEGSFTIKSGVESFSADKVTAISLAGASDLETLDITGALDPDVSTDKAGPAITIEDNSNIESITLAGKVGAVIIEGNGNLTDVVISAEVDGKINIGDGAAADGNTDLTNVTLTGAKATAIEVSNNTDLAELTIDLTFWAGTGTSAKLDGNVEVTTNASLTSLTVSSDKIENLTVTGNDDLTNVNFTGLKVAGATGSPEVYIYNNDLSGSMTDAKDGDTNVANGKTGDLGSITSASGIETLKTYLTAVAADADSTVKVLMDTVDFTNESDSTTEYTYATSADDASEYLRVAYITPNDAAAGVAATKAKRTLLIDLSTFPAAGSNVQIWAGGLALLDIDGNGTTAEINVNKDLESMYLALSDPDNIARAASAGVTMSVTKNGNASVDVHIGATLDSAVFETTNATASALSINVSDVINITVGNQTVTTMMGAHTAGNYTSVAKVIQSAWDTAQTASDKLFDFSVSSVASSTIAATKMTFSSVDKGNIGAGITPKITFTPYLSTNVVIVPIMIGATKSSADNSSTGTDLLITFESTVAGSLLSKVGQPASSATSGTYSAATVSYTLEGATANTDLAEAFVELHTNLRATAKTGTATGTDSHPDESWTDAVYAEEAIAAAASNAVNYSRIGWLAGS